jgi:hypothetical protein
MRLNLLQGLVKMNTVSRFRNRGSVYFQKTAHIARFLAAIDFDFYLSHIFLLKITMPVTGFVLGCIVGIKAYHLPILPVTTPAIKPEVLTTQSVKAVDNPVKEFLYLIHLDKHGDFHHVMDAVIAETDHLVTPFWL